MKHGLRHKAAHAVQHFRTSVELSGVLAAKSQATRKTLYEPSVEDKGVEQRIYLRWVKSQLDNENACLELPVTILLLVSFSCLALFHLNQNLAFTVEQGIERDIRNNANFAFAHHFGHKDIVDVHSFADFWSWLRLGLIPLVIQPSWGYSEEYAAGAAAAMGRFNTSNVNPSAPTELWQMPGYGMSAPMVPARGDYLRFNRIIGGLRFRQQLAPAAVEYCTFPESAPREAWMQWYGKPCMPAWEELAFKPTSEDAEVFDHPDRVEWMYLLDPLTSFIAKAVDMEDGCEQLPAKQRSTCLCEWCAQQTPPSPWLTEETHRIEISFASYNPNYGLMSLTGVNFFFNRGGFISKRVEVMSSWMDPWSRPLPLLLFMLACDACWIGLLLYIFVLEVKEVVGIIRGAGNEWFTAIMNDYLHFWNVVDWASFFVAAVVVALFLQLHAASGVMHNDFKTLIEEETKGQVQRAHYSALVDTFYTSLERVVGREKYFRLSLCLYPMMVMLRLFKSFAAQPRLAVVTETLAIGAVDMIHFFLVFFSVLACLCLDSVLVFGQDIQAFATFPRALHTCFRMMFGDWDWPVIEQIQRTHAGAWFVCFMLIIVIILVNIVVAIMMKAYVTVKESTADSYTLAQQIREMLRRRRQFRNGERVRLNDIWNKFLAEARENGSSEKEMLESTTLITTRLLMEKVENIPPTQAKRTINNSWDEEMARNASPPMIEEAEQPLNHCNMQTQAVRNDLFHMYHRMEYYDTIGSGDASTALDAEEAAKAAMDDTGKPPQSMINEDLLGFVNSEVGRLSGETASVLAQTMRRVDARQSRIEERQADMLAAVHEVQEALQRLQGEAYQVATKMQRNAFERKQRGQKASVWRRGLPLVPACFDCSPGAMDTPPMPPIPASAARRTSERS
mmetsp:Transcript_73367/g.203659  ORF Transcript_73367/g.203659 Transcript_73367/m.203659 type:complete len:903 (+) Transcript_73367:149-2857(+)